MKQNKYPQTETSASVSQSAAAAEANSNAINVAPSATEIARKATLSAGGITPKDFVPFPAEVARRAYFSYVNQGSLSGHEVQHWLAAEAELIAERDLTRIHGYHHGKKN